LAESENRSARPTRDENVHRSKTDLFPRSNQKDNRSSEGVIPTAHGKNDVQLIPCKTCFSNPSTSILQKWQTFSPSVSTISDNGRTEMIFDVSPVLHEEFESNVVTLIGNKVDLEDRTITGSEAEAFAERHQLVYFEASALGGDNIHEAFHRTAATKAAFWKSNTC
jgi:hypothetical protein